MQTHYAKVTDFRSLAIRVDANAINKFCYLNNVFCIST